jgi:hypothetical protein
VLKARNCIKPYSEEKNVQFYVETKRCAIAIFIANNDFRELCERVILASGWRLS